MSHFSRLLRLACFSASIAAAAEPKVFTIKTLQAQMRYDVNELSIAPGAEVKIIFENTDDMPHNMVFFQPGTDVVAVANAQMEKPEEALKRNWLPEDPRMWLHSKMLNPKEKDELVFKAPDKAGVYPFVCTFPGHAVTMQGRLRIYAPGPQLSKIKYALYLGDWGKLPNFAALTPHREGELPGNLIEIKLDDYKNQFGLVYTGQINAPKEGEYRFFLASDDGARLLINGKVVVDNDGVHASTHVREGKVKLTAGEHEVRIEYFQGGGEAELAAAWQGSDFALTPLSTWMHPSWREGAPKKDTHQPIVLKAEQEPVIYRNFIKGAGNRGIGVGYPGGLNIAWSAEWMNVALMWRGAFFDAGRHWKDRGGGHQQVLGYDIVVPGGSGALPFAVLAELTAEWPTVTKDGRAEGYQWRGYTLDAKRYPTFGYEWNGAKISDRFDVEPGAALGEGKLVRTLRVEGKLPENALFRAAAGDRIEAKGNAFTVHVGPHPLTVTVDGAQVAGKSLLVPARAEIKVTYSWQLSHTHHATAGHTH